MPLPSLLLLLALATTPASKAHVRYTLTVDTTDLSTFAVRMQVSGAPASFTIAASAHPEYDDKYWRYLEEMQVEGGSAERLDSVRWTIRAPAGNATIRYRIRPPVVDGLRASWRAFLTPYGGLVGGPHSFLYVIGGEAWDAQVTMDIPAGWRIATGLDSTGARTYHAGSIEALLDSPILVGPDMRISHFSVDGVRHDIAYWGTPDGTPFDTAAFVTSIERLTRQTVAFWGRMPYHRYVFMFEDGAWEGGLEHTNSVTLGATSAALAKNPDAAVGEVAHEYFHTWNLMAIRPAGYREVDYRVQEPLPQLWFSEGLTMFYADLMRRRASLPVQYATRDEHLAMLIARYLSNSGNWHFSAEQISRTAYNAPAGALGDFSGSAHLQGELIAAMLDMIIRNATGGTRSMDDAMRLMLTRFSSRPFEDRDIEDAVHTVCGCDVKPFFDAHVRSAHELDFARWLALVGLRPVVTREPASDSAGHPTVDLRILARPPSPGDTLRVLLWVPDGAWVRAGLHTNDRLLAINGHRLATWPEVQALLRKIRVGDPVRFDIVRDGVPRTITARAAGYETVTVRVEDLPGSTPRQARLREAWRRIHMSP